MKVSREEARRILERQVSAVEWEPQNTRAVLRRIREEEKTMKKRMPVGLAAALAMLLLAGLAVAAGLPQILDSIRRSVGDVTLPEAQDRIAAIGATAESEGILFTVTEALYDGYGAYIMVEARPRDAHTLLVPISAEPDERAVNVVDTLAEDDATTLAEYAAANGYTKIVCADATPRDKGESASVATWHDGVLTLGVSFAAAGEELHVDMTCVYAPCGGEQVGSGHVQIPLTLTAMEPLWTAAITEGVDCPELGLRVEKMTVTGTALSVYVQGRLRVTDAERYLAAQPELTVLDDEGHALERGMMWPGTYSFRTQFLKDYRAYPEKLERLTLQFTAEKTRQRVTIPVTLE